MDKRNNKRIGVFQAAHPLQMHTCNLVRKLLDHGYAVDVFFHDIKSYYDMDETIKDPANLTIHTYGYYASAYEHGSIPQPKLRDSAVLIYKHIFRIYRILYNLFVEYLVYEYFDNLLKIDMGISFFSPRTIKRTLADMYGKEYVCLIGVEKMGLIWSGIIAEKLKIPNIYYSLELYTHEHGYPKSSKKNGYIKRTEEIYHKKCHATIVQDRRRAEVLYASNGVDFNKIKLLCLPVSSLGDCIYGKTRYCYEKWGLEESNIVLLYSGSIQQSRWIDKVIEVSKEFPHQWKLLLHGIDRMKAQVVVDQAGVSDRVILSTNILRPAELIQLILSSTIGLVIYGNTNQNDMLTGFSSEKLSLYLQCGIPIIAFNYPSYEAIKDYRCGVLIDNIDEIPSAITEILADYSCYQENACKCFEDVYKYSKHFMNVLEYIDNLSNHPRSKCYNYV